MPSIGSIAADFIPITDNPGDISPEAFGEKLQNQRVEELKQQTKQVVEKHPSKWNYLLIELSPGKNAEGIKPNKLTIEKMIWIDTNFQHQTISNAKQKFGFDNPKDITRFIQLASNKIDELREETELKYTLIKIFLPYHLITSFNIEDWRKTITDNPFGHSYIVVYQIRLPNSSTTELGYLKDKYRRLHKSPSVSKMRLICSKCDKDSCLGKTLASENVFYDEITQATTPRVAWPEEEHSGVVLTDASAVSFSQYLRQIYTAGTPIFIWPRQPVSSEQSYTTENYCQKMAELLKKNAGQHSALLETFLELRSKDPSELLRQISIIWQDPEHFILVSSPEPNLVNRK